MNYNPKPTKKIPAFHFYTQATIPFVYDNSLSFLELLGKMGEYLNETSQNINALIDNMNSFTDLITTTVNDLIDNWESYQTELNNQWMSYKTELNEEWNSYKTELNGQWDSYKTELNNQWTSYQSELNTQFNDFKNYVTTYLQNLDISKEISDKLDEMESDGTLATIINEDIFNELNEKITTLEQSTRGYLTPEMFGARANSSPDGNFEAFQKLFNASRDQNKDILIAGGTYSITYDASHQNLVIQTSVLNDRVPVIQFANNSGIYITESPQAPAAMGMFLVEGAGVTIKNGRFSIGQGELQAGYVFNIDGSKINNETVPNMDFHMENCKFYGASSGSVYITWGSNCTFTNCSFSGVDPVQIGEKSHHNYFYHCIFQDQIPTDQLTTPTHAISLNGSSFNYFYDSDFIAQTFLSTPQTMNVDGFTNEIRNSEITVENFMSFPSTSGMPHDPTNVILINCIYNGKPYQTTVTPEMFGAVGDGEHSDRTQIQNAINYATENKLPLLFSRVYDVSENGGSSAQAIYIQDFDNKPNTVTFTNNAKLIDRTHSGSSQCILRICTINYSYFNLSIESSNYSGLLNGSNGIVLGRIGTDDVGTCYGNRFYNTEILEGKTPINIEEIAHDNTFDNTNIHWINTSGQVNGIVVDGKLNLFNNLKLTCDNSLGGNYGMQVSGYGNIFNNVTYYRINSLASNANPSNTSFVNNVFLDQVASWNTPPTNLKVTNYAFQVTES